MYTCMTCGQLNIILPSQTDSIKVPTFYVPKGVKLYIILSLVGEPSQNKHFV